MAKQGIGNQSGSVDCEVAVVPVVVDGLEPSTVRGRVIAIVARKTEFLEQHRLSVLPPNRALPADEIVEFPDGQLVVERIAMPRKKIDRRDRRLR